MIRTYQDIKNGMPLTEDQMSQDMINVGSYHFKKHTNGRVWDDLPNAWHSWVFQDSPVKGRATAIFGIIHKSYWGSDRMPDNREIAMKVGQHFYNEVLRACSHRE